MTEHIEPSAEELSVSRREHPDVPQAILELAISMAYDRGGSTIPVGSYDIQRARDQMAADASESATLRAELAAAKVEIASLRRTGPQDGYSLAFYELAKLMGIGARAAAPGHVWRTEMLPRLIRALAADPVSYADTLNLENAGG